MDTKPSFVVGIGGSAGGLKAYTEILQSLPAHTGMAFVIIAHLNPKTKSLLTHILARSTIMPTSQATDGLSILADHVYVIPPNANLYMEKLSFRLISPRTLNQGRHSQVDHFLESLAEAMGPHAIGIILSGGDGDGTQGCKKIKALGGKTFAQDISAEVNSMPRHAQASGCVDKVLSPTSIAMELIHISLSDAFSKETERPSTHLL